jgi:hypothetical protein
MIKNITREELLTTYKDNHGFAFLSKHAIRDSSIYALADTLIAAKITSSKPIAVTRYKESVIFIYNDFNGPEFFQRASFFEQAYGVARIVPFLEYVNVV